MKIGDEVLDLVYAETWRLREVYRARQADVQGVPSGIPSMAMAYAEIASSEYMGGTKVLARLLLARGEIGLRVFPARPREEQPDAQQAAVKLFQWAAAKKFVTPEELRRFLRVNPQMQQALERLGQDYRPTMAEVKGQ